MDQLKEYHNTVLDYLELCNSPVFRLLKNNRIKPHQVATENLLKVFALELRLKAFEPGFPKDAASGLLTDQFP
jgi:hypothetical protein